MKLTDNLYLYPERGMMDCNTYIIKGKPNIIIDVGSPQFLPTLVSEMPQDGFQPEDIDLIVNTHFHGDHWWGNNDFKQLSGAKILLHPLQKKFWPTTVSQTDTFFGIKSIALKDDGYLDDNILGAGDANFDIIHTPGHSQDSLCFFCREQGYLICGDVVFAQNTGRVDLPGGSADELKQSIESLSRLPAAYLLPGHMGPVMGAENVKRNFEFVIQHVFPWL